MIPVFMLVAAVLIIGYASSTPADRTAVNETLRPYRMAAGIAAAVIWAALLM